MTRAGRVALLLTAVVPVAICRPSVADACASAEMVGSQIVQESPAAEVRLVGDPLASRLRIGISTLVGQHVPLGGQYLVPHSPVSLTTYVVRFERGCATHHGRFPHELVRTWLEGSPA